jgi:hypothetical protein
MMDKPVSACLLALVTSLVPLAVAAGKPAPRIAVKSGTPQTARAWVAARANRYEAKFDNALVVSVWPPKAKVRFRCITRGCEFPASEQPDSVTRIDAGAYDVAAANGEAAIKLTVWTVTPEDVVVIAQPAEADGPQVRFTLNEQ